MIGAERNSLFYRGRAGSGDLGGLHGEGDSPAESPKRSRHGQGRVDRACIMEKKTVLTKSQKPQVLEMLGKQ